ncbi:MAG TPA: tetraacyldisaccharide 4'-kinase [Salinimicrobium sp.]|nr:tetraacyldisaccharide 4'-kinase [Salinimicrobium sp.]
MSLRKLLFPFSILYDGVVGTRNYLYNTGFFKSKKYDIPVLCIGNLNVGGTGKSPMVEYVATLLKADYKVAVLSRGYKRKSKGFYLLKGDEKAEVTGDEPLQFKMKFPNVVVAVDENRQHGIAEILNLENPDVIILDDAFQHRKVTAGYNILLSAFGDLYIDDLLLPAGNLRENRAGAKRANAVVVTKCPPDLSEEEMQTIQSKLKIEKQQQLFFTSIEYASKLKGSKKEMNWSELKEKATLVTGIANPKPLISHLEKIGLKNSLKHLKFPDHHIFSEREINQINSFDMVITTEKDYMRLKDKISEEKLFYIPIEVRFIKNKKIFDSDLQYFVNEKMR